MKRGDMVIVPFPFHDKRCSTRQNDWGRRWPNLCETGPDTLYPGPSD